MQLLYDDTEINITFYFNTQFISTFLHTTVPAHFTAAKPQIKTL